MLPNWNVDNFILGAIKSEEEKEKKVLSGLFMNPFECSCAIWVGLIMHEGDLHANCIQILMFLIIFIILLFLFLFFVLTSSFGDFFLGLYLMSEMSRTDWIATPKWSSVQCFLSANQHFYTTYMKHSQFLLRKQHKFYIHMLQFFFLFNLIN